MSERVATVNIGDCDDLADVLPELCERHRALSDEISAADKERKEIKGEIDALMGAAGERKVAGPGWLVVQSINVRSSLSPERLLKKGVTMATIEYATVRTEKAYFQVRKAK